MNPSKAFKTKKKWLAILIFGAAILYWMRPEKQINPDKPHHTNKGFRNPRPHKDFGLRDYPPAVWEFLNTTVKKEPQPTAPTDYQFLQANRTATTVTWIGHSAFLIQHNGLNIITDPHLGKRASPVSWAGPERITPLTVNIEQLPPIDVVLISHDHYDHIDESSIRALLEKQSAHQPQFFVPLKVRSRFASLGATKVAELDWWESREFSGWTLACVPAQHYSGRGLLDKNETLWSGWVAKTDDFSYYFTGDSGYNPDFAEIGKRFGPFDLASINIGAYGPEWASNGVHLNPEQAVQVHKDVRSKLSVAAHWGTFVLSLEDLDEPPMRLQNELEKQSIEPSHFRVLKHGETLKIEKRIDK